MAWNRHHHDKGSTHEPTARTGARNGWMWSGRRPRGSRSVVLGGTDWSISVWSFPILSLIPLTRTLTIM